MQMPLITGQTPEKKPAVFSILKKPRNLKKRYSLTWRMIRLLILCWVLPVALLIFSGGVLLHQSLMEQSVESYTLSAQAASQLTSLRLESAITASRNASYIGTIKQAWTEYTADGDKVALYQASRTFLEQQYQNDVLFSSTILLFSDFEDEPIYVINGTAGGTDRVRKSAEEIIEEAQVISETLDTGIAFFSVGQRVFMMRNLVDSNYQTIAVLMMELNTDLLFVEFSQMSSMEFSTACVSDVIIPLVLMETLEDAEAQVSTSLEGVIIPLGEDEIEVEQGSVLLPVASGQEGVFVNYSDGVLFVEVLVSESDYSFAYYGVTNPDIMQEQWNMMLILLVAIFVLTLPLGALIYRFFAQQVNRPVRKLIKMAEKIRQEEYGAQLPEGVMQSTEFGTLGDDFNQMSLRLKQQFEHIYKEEISLRDARIMALQSQINPHFLNNTLEIINWEARMQGNIKVCNMLESLSTMLNAAMDRNSNHEVHLSQELMYVDAYLYIINERLGKRLVFERDIPEEFLDVMVPRLVLQPLLENAVEHGITPVQQGRIALRATQEGAWLILSVENDGALSPENYERIQYLLSGATDGQRLASGSLGLRNVHQRLRILYGDESGILVDITKKDMTIFKLKVKLG